MRRVKIHLSSVIGAVIIWGSAFSQLDTPVDTLVTHQRQSDWSVDGFDHWFIDVHGLDLILGNSKPVLFYSRNQLGDLYFTASGVTITAPKPLTSEQEHELHEHYEAKERGEEAREFEYPEPYTYHFELVDVNPKVEILGNNECAHYSVIGQSKVTNYDKLLYQNIYPNIDLLFSFPAKGGLKYDIIVHPGGDVNDILIKHGNSVIEKLENGDVLISTESYSLTDEAPTAETSDGRPLMVAFETEKNMVSFRLENDYPEGEITIDPVIDFSRIRWSGLDLHLSQWSGI